MHDKRNSRGWLLRSTLPFFLASLTACDLFGPSGGRSVRPELMRLPTDPAPSLGFVAASPGSAFTWSSGIDIASLRSPIRGITLRGEHSQDVYTCDAGSNDGCLVELNGPALQDLLSAQAVTIRSGTYTSLEISTCGSEGQYTAYLSGTVSLGGASYVTQTSGVLSASGNPEPVALQYTGCARNYPLPVPLVIADSAAPVSLKLYFDIRDVAWASLGAPETAGAWLPSGCAGPRPDESGQSAARPFLCGSYPDVAGVVDDRVPSVERYRINDGATIGLLFQGTSGRFVGGFSRRYFVEGAPSNPGFNADTPVDEFTDLGNGSYHLSTYGGYGPGNTPVAHYLVMPAFRRESHSGSATNNTGSFQYSAIRLP